MSQHAKRTSKSGPKLGRRLESMIEAALERHNASCQVLRRPEEKVVANWTQPRFRKLQRGNTKVWTPAGKGWVDLGLFYRDGHIQVDLKAADMAADKNKNRWSLDEKLRRDKDGHQIATLDRLAALGHRVGVLLGAWHKERLQPWELYLVPVELDFHRASIPWEELAPYTVDYWRWWRQEVGQGKAEGTKHRAAAGGARGWRGGGE